tara:strand:- start:14374 stop:15576 length:1203 start_codon:yes stop_codon:yes gene_type:complete
MNQDCHWSADSEHSVTWKQVTEKTPRKIYGLFEVQLTGTLVPWSHFIFFTPPNMADIMKQTKYILKKLKRLQHLNPQNILLHLRKKEGDETLLFRDPYFVKDGVDTAAPPRQPQKLHTTSRFFVSDIVNPTNVVPSSDDWSQFIYNPGQSTSSADNSKSLPLSISEQLNRVIHGDRDSTQNNAAESTVSSSSAPVPSNGVVDQDPMHTESENEHHITDVDPETLRGYTTGLPPNKPGVYVLKLDNGKYYVGQSESSVRDRIEEHKGRGYRCAYFVKRNTTSSSPLTYLRPKSYIPDDLERWEEEETLHAMLTFGFNNVRGYVWSRLEHTLDDYKMLKKTLGGRLKCCYECGMKGHLVTKCPNVNTTNKTHWAADLDRLIREEKPAVISLAQSAAAYMGNS